MDGWTKEHFKACIRAERASKILTPIDEGLCFQVRECDETIKDNNATEPITFKCLRCGKRFTSYGRKAELLKQMALLLFEYGEVVGKTSKRKTNPTELHIVEYHAKCCERPLILNTYPERGSY